MIVLLDQFCQLGGTSKKAICQKVIVSEFSEMPLSRAALQVAYLPISNIQQQNPDAGAGPLRFVATSLAC